jgi:hypothetical protein
MSVAQYDLEQLQMRSDDTEHVTIGPDERHFKKSMQFILIFESTLLAGLRVTTERFVNSDNS